MSILLYKTQCPQCKELGKDKHKDNLGIYDDGHCFCFSCGYYTSGNAVEKHKNKNNKKNNTKDIPEDISKTITKEANDWLHKYFDTIPNNFYYSESEQSLIVLIKDKNNYPIAWQKRYFGTNKDYPKWVSYGISESLFHIEGNSNTSIVLVEDIISATKVGHILPTLCLFGSNVSTKRIATLLLLGYNHIILWLDPDKKNYMIDRKKQIDKLCNCSVILSEHDPKDYTNEQINELLISYKTTPKERAIL